MSKFFKNLMRKKTLNNTNYDEVNYTDMEGSPVYGALPVDSYLVGGYDSEPIKDIRLVFEGENKDTFVLVPGLLPYDTIEIGGIIIADYWGDVKEQVEDPCITSPSPFGSLHDRAVELYYQIKGGQVDYGLVHSHQFCHKQLGETYEGLVPNWSPENPIVLIGKGYGATTALYLQHLLSTNFFGQHTAGKMIKGIICWSAPHRGSTLPYYLGLEPGSRCLVHPFSILQLLLSLIHLICYFTFLEKLFNFGLNDKFGLAPKSEGGEQSLGSALSARSRFSCFGDNFLADWSVEGARMRYAGDEKDKHYLDPHCIYLNYVSTGRTWKSKITGHYWPRLSWRNIPTWFISIMLGRYKLATDAERQVLRTSSSTYWQNDGTLSVHAQLPPPHQHVLMNIALDQRLYDPVEHEITPGVWYNLYVNDPSQTVLFNSVPSFITLSFIDYIINWSFTSHFINSLSRHSESFESFYIRFIEFCERSFRFSSKKSHINYDDNVSFSDSSAKSYFPTTTSERTDKFTSDKAGLEWIHKIETMEILTSPSKMLYWMNQMQSTLDNGSPLSETGKKNDFSFSSTTSLMQGPMFIKAKRRLTADDYKASVMNCDGS
ncbi:8828_t:CDS:2 [Dentiscutata erythropus]|uniref:8828_t:CDS:1 n=1 Tax=Dentiscutata erythropus TaxID=1348616 RepID=A0A9N9JKR8_9GLOM|nr:8828_t:CDS:2 [Dentiscutata erythropus]